MRSLNCFDISTHLSGEGICSRSLQGVSYSEDVFFLVIKAAVNAVNPSKDGKSTPGIMVRESGHSVLR